MKKPKSKNLKTRRNWLEVNLNHIEHNYHHLSSLAQKSYLPVLKANAYGHGAVPVCARLLQSGAKFFALADVTEGVELRQKLNLPPKIKIIILSPVIDEWNVNKALKHDLTLTIGSVSALDRLEKVIQKHNLSKPLAVWLKINTGMNRLGIKPELAKHAVRQIEAEPKLKLEMILTHLSSAEEPAEVFTHHQIKIFNDFLSSLNHPHPISIGNSAFLLNPEIKQHDDLTRGGLALYGVSPFYFEKPPKTVMKNCQSLKPTCSLKARIIALHSIETGDYVGYSRTYEAQRPIEMATIAIGYADGYPRHIPSGTPVLLHGQRAEIIGRVSMDCFSIDLKGISAQIGDVVTLFGDGLDVNEIAAAAGTIAYEILCRTQPRGGIVYLS